MGIVYALTDPMTLEVRYVGKSVRGIERAEEHWKQKRWLHRNDHCHAWVRKLLKIGFLPSIDVLEEVENDQLDEVERFWIGSWKMMGADLTNMTDGGEGFSQSFETRERISRTMKGRPSPLKGRRFGPRPPEVVEKIRKSQLGISVPTRGKRKT